jgi:hypothetical protein
VSLDLPATPILCTVNTQKKETQMHPFFIKGANKTKILGFPLNLKIQLFVGSQINGENNFVCSCLFIKFMGKPNNLS